jgi:hypothetical protein
VELDPADASSAVLPESRENPRFGLQKRPGNARNIREISSLYVGLACRAAAEFAGFCSGIAGEFGGMIAHPIFVIVIDINAIK